MHASKLEACEFIFGSSSNIGKNIGSYSVTIQEKYSKCSPKVLVEYLENIKRTYGAASYEASTAKELIKRYFSDGRRSATSYLKYPGTPGEEKVTFSMVNMVVCTKSTPDCKFPELVVGGPDSPVSNDPVAVEQFKEEFETSYDASFLGDPMDFTHSGIGSTDFLTSPEASMFFGTGMAFAQLIYDGTFTALGADIGAAFKTIAFSDRNAKLAAIPAQAEYLQQSMFAALAFQAQIEAYSNELLKLNQSIIIQNDLEFRTIFSNIDSLNSHSTVVESKVNELKNNGQSSFQVTQIKQAEQLHNLGLSDEALAQIMAGKLDDKAVARQREGIALELASFGSNFSLDKLKGLQKAIQDEKNPMRLLQLQNILRSFLNEDQIVAQWAGLSPKSIRFSSPRDSAFGRAVRSVTNEALGARLFAKNPKSLQNAMTALTSAERADQYFARGDNFGKVMGNVLLSRAQTIMDYELHPEIAAVNKQYKLTSDSKALFGLNVTADTADGYEIIKVAGRLAQELKLRVGEEDYFIARALLESAQYYANKAGYALQFEAALGQAWTLYYINKGILKEAWAISKSILSGTIDFVCMAVCMDTIGEPVNAEVMVHGIRDLGSAILNHEQTLAKISAAIDQKIAEYPNLSTEEKAALLTNITINTALAVYTGGTTVMFSAQKLANFTRTLRVLGLSGEAISLTHLKQAKSILTGLSQLNLTLADAEAIAAAYGSGAISALANQNFVNAALRWQRSEAGLSGLYLNLGKTAEALTSLEKAAGLEAGTLAKMLAEGSDPTDALNKLTQIAERAIREGKDFKLGTDKGFWLEGSEPGSNILVLTDDGKIVSISASSRGKFADSGLVDSLFNEYPHASPGSIIDEAIRRGITQTNEIDGALKSGVKTGKGLSEYLAKTEATGTPGGKPKGIYEPLEGDAERKRGIRRQNETADILANEGFDVEMLLEKPEGNGFGRNAASNPDIKIGNRVFDVYSPTSTNLNKIRNALSDKVTNQADRIILNLNDSPFTSQSIVEYLYRKPISDLKELIIIKGGKIEHVFPF